MSSYLFPYTLPGIQFNYIRKYLWNTGVQKALTGKQSTIAYQAFPLVNFEYSFEYLRAPADITELVGLFNAVRGRFDTFLHTDPDFNTVSAEAFGAGDGSTTAFQLLATYEGASGPGQAEMVQNLNGTPTLYSNGTLIASSGYSIGATGIVTFTTAPASGVALTWDGSFYYRCRFDADSYDWKKIMSALWQSPKLSFTSVVL